MTTEPHNPAEPPAAEGHESVEMPRPTAAPLVLSLGVALLATGIVAGPAFLIVGATVLAAGLGIWITQLLPGRGHFHEAFVEPALRPRPVTGVAGTVDRLETGMPGYRVRLPEKVHPISAGVKGGIAGGLVIPLPALIYGLVSGQGIWYPVNLLAGMVLPGVADRDLTRFYLDLFVLGIFIHATTSVILGLMYGVLLPSLPPIPQAMAWSSLLAPILWTGASYTLMGIVNPGLRAGVSWPWFIVSQFVYGVAMSLVVTQATWLRPVTRGLLGGALGGMLMPLPAMLWALGSGRGFWYPVNLLAGMVISGHNDPSAPEMREFHAGWLAQALVMHAVFALGFGVACALLLPRLRPIPSPFAWGALLMPLLWTAASYALMGVVNPVLQEKVDWPWFIVSQFIFGLVAAIVVVRSEMVHIPPAGRGPDRVADFVAGQG